MFPVRGRRRVDRAGIAARRSDTARLENVLGSAVPAFVVTALVSGRAGVWDLARRSLRWRVPLRWYLVGLLAPLLILLIAVTILNGFAPLRALGQNWLLLFTAFLPALAIMILLNNVAEEIGWGRIRLRPIPRSSWSAPRRLVNHEAITLIHTWLHPRIKSSHRTSGFDELLSKLEFELSDLMRYRCHPGQNVTRQQTQGELV
jgi:hypothetical protein